MQSQELNEDKCGLNFPDFIVFDISTLVTQEGQSKMTIRIGYGLSLEKNHKSKYFSITLDILSLATSLSLNTSECFCFKCLNANLTSSPHNLHFAFPNIDSYYHKN